MTQVGGQVHASRGSEPAPQSPRVKPKQGIPADIQMNPRGTRRALLKGGAELCGGDPNPAEDCEAFVFTWDGAQQTRLKPPVPRRPTNAILLQLYIGGGGGVAGQGRQGTRARTHSHVPSPPALLIAIPDRPCRPMDNAAQSLTGGFGGGVRSPPPHPPPARC